MIGLDEVRRGYDALRDRVGAHRLAVDAVSVTGPQATEYLQGQLSQDIDPLGVGQSAPALLLEPDGKLCALVRATRTAADGWVLDTDAPFGAAVAERLRRFKLRMKVDIDALDWSAVALRGAAGSAVLPSDVAGAPNTEGAWVLPVELNGTHGVDILGPRPDALVPTGVEWVTDAAWDALRVEAGIPKMGSELDARTIAAEAGLVERTVSFTKGCYTGQELVARLDARGSRVARRLCGLVAGTLAPEDAPRLSGATLWAPEGEKSVGRVTSAAWCPGLGAVGALAYLHRSVGIPGDVEWSAPDVPGAREGESGSTRSPARALEVPLVGG